MKKAITLILTLFLVLSLQAQNFKLYKPQKEEMREGLKVIGVYTASIIFDAMADGYRDEGNKQLSHALEAASIGTLVASPFIIKYERDKWGWYIGTYACLRYTFFDYTYNVTRGLPLSYRGTTSVYDEILGKAPPEYINFTKYVSFVVGVSIPLDKFRNKNWVQR